MENIIQAAVQRGASDLHIKAGDVFRARIHGKLVPLTKQALTPEQTRTIALHLMQNEDDKARLDSYTDYERQLANTVRQTEDHAEGRASFREKRAPVYAGR